MRLWLKNRSFSRIFLLVTAVCLEIVATHCGSSSDESPVNTPAEITDCPNLLGSPSFDQSLPFLVANTADCSFADKTDPISGCVDATHDIVIGPSRGPKCTKVFFDRSFTGADGLGKISIEPGGEVYVRDENVSVEVGSVEVGGLFQVGSKSCPIGTGSPNHQVNITFTGSRPCKSPNTCSGFNKGIQVSQKGTLRLFGVKGVPASSRYGGNETGISWTTLSTPAGDETKFGASSGAIVPVPVGGASTLQLANDVTQGPGAWQPGDWIAIGTTGFSSVETEIVQIDTLSPNGSGGTEVHLKPGQPLKHYHFGGMDPGVPSDSNYTAGADRNFGVDERAEVGLLSRNIKLTARIEPGSNDDEKKNNLHWGGELKFTKGFDEISIQGVELEKFGKDQLGSYPFHIHEVGDLNNKGLLLNGNSVHHSYNKCVTVHSSQNLAVENNVCARIMGHIFYEEIGDESGIYFINNLGLGAMSHYFYVSGASDAEREQKIKDSWWSGDYLGQKASPTYNGYDGFNIPNVDAQNNPTRGVCAKPAPAGGGLLLGLNPNTPEHAGNCNGDELYIEPASGFWLINPQAVLIGNSIGGCQDVGRGYWYVPPQNRTDAGVPPDLANNIFKPVGCFKNNRVHSCYSGLYAEREFGVMSNSLFPYQDGDHGKKPIVATFNGLTATRNRDRGVWLRPVFYVLEHGRFATNRDSVTLVSSGGLEGNYPGVWALLTKSVLVGLSQNNVDRWGPCPVNGAKGFECVDNTHPAPSAPNDEKGFVLPNFNTAGYMIYDGPVRIFHNRFVNFLTDLTGLLTKADSDFLASYSSFPNGNNPNQYQGDAALGWFQGNQSAYPTATASKELTWTNTTLRHQIYTEKVNLGDFQDGDKNTAIIDLDGSLTGFEVLDNNGKKVDELYPISLNNLPFNASSNSVDECLSEGAQDKLAEGRPTSLISPGSMATLEFQNIWPEPTKFPYDSNKQTVTFTKDSEDHGARQTMELTSRNGQGIWEPKVTSGYGYTLGISPCVGPNCSPTAGIGHVLSVGLTDPVKPGISATNPFFVRLGICYTNILPAINAHPQNPIFHISRGYRSYGGGNVVVTDKDLQVYWNELNNRYNGEVCSQLDHQLKQNLSPDVPGKGCPANGVSAVPAGGCKPPSSEITIGADKACLYPKTDLDPAADISELTSGGLPVMNKYFYDKTTGMLFFNVMQDIPNAFGPSPLGSCPDANNPFCPESGEESYYACPAGGCVDYVVRLDDSLEPYHPGPSVCSPYPTYAQTPPPNENQLVKLGTTNPVVRVEEGGNGGLFPHFLAQDPPECPVSNTP
ncbi:MAG: G8 domain-containing protein [bacterium]